MAQLQSLEEIEPIKHFGASVTIPLAYKEGEEFPWPVGSGTLLHDDHRLFILTAAHIFDDCDVNRFWVPTDRVGGRPRPIGKASLKRAKERDLFDIAVIELLDDALRRTISGNWGSVPVSQVGPASVEGTFFLFGYPTEKLRSVEKTLMCSLITACTRRLLAPPKNASDPLDPDVDMFFLHEETAEDEDGQEVESPHLRGVSGGGIWEVLESQPGTLWTAEKNMRLVGVQSSTIHGEWFRAKASVTALSALV